MPSKIEHEFQKEIAAFMADEIAKVKVQVRTEGGVHPKISLLYRRKGEISSMIAPVPGHFIETESGKEYLTKVAIPTLVEIFNKTGATIICLAWITEAWLWKIDNSERALRLTSEQIDQAKKTTERIEIVMLSFETAYDCRPVMFKKIGDALELMDEMGEATHLEGRFTTLFRKQPSNN